MRLEFKIKVGVSTLQGCLRVAEIAALKLTCLLITLDALSVEPI